MKIHQVFLLILCIGVAVSHIAYTVRSRQYPQWDEHSYLGLMVRNYDVLRTKGLLAGYSEIFAENENRQPIYPLFLSYVVLVTGLMHSYKIALAINGLFFIGSIIGTYFFAKNFFDETTSILSAYLFATLGNALFYSHFTYTETAVTTCIVWSLVFLFKTQEFTRKNLSLIAGFSFALATLTRFVAPVFLVGAVFSQMFNKHKVSKINILLFFIVAIGLSLIFYFIPNWNEFMSYMQKNQEQGKQWVEQYRSAEMANTFSTRSIMFYFNILSQNTIYIFLAFVIGFLYCLFRIKKTFPLILSFIIPYAFLTFVTVWKEDRFLVPLYPVFAIIAASSIQVFKKGMIKTFMITLLVAISFLNFLGAVWAIGPMGQKGLTDMVLPEFIHHPRRIYLTPLVWPPTKEYINAHQLFELLGNTSGQQVLQLFDYEPWDIAIHSLLSYEKRGWFTITKVPGEEKYVLTKNTFLDSGNLIGKIYLPIDGSTVFVYKK